MRIFASDFGPLSRARERLGVRAIALPSEWIGEVLRRVGTPCPPTRGKTVRSATQRQGGQRLPTLQKSGSWIRRNTP